MIYAKRVSLSIFTLSVPNFNESVALQNKLFIRIPSRYAITVS